MPQSLRVPVGALRVVEEEPQPSSRPLRVPLASLKVVDEDEEPEGYEPLKPYETTGSGILDNALALAGGIRAGVASTVFHGGDLVRRLFGMERVIDDPDNQALMTPPDHFLGKVGYYGEQAAEFAVPMAKVATAARGSRMLTKMAAEGAASTGVAAVQSGGDPTQMMLAGGLGAVAPPAGALVRAGYGAVKRAAAGAEEGGLGGALAEAMRTAAPSTPKEMVTQALKPRSTNVRFDEALDRALPEIKAVATAKGRPIQSLDDAFEDVIAAKKANRAQYDAIAGPYRQRGQTVDLEPVADAVVDSIPRKLRLENPKAAQRLEELADVYRSRFKLDDAEQLLKETNAELDAYYHKYPTAQRKAATADPEIAHTVAQAKALRNAIYSTLDDPGQHGAARELQRRYGALMSVEEEMYRRMNVAARQQPESLSEQIGKVRAAAQMARGAYKATFGGPWQAVSGVADIMGARAGRATATYLKEQQTTDALIRRAFKSYSGTPGALVVPQQPVIRGQLGPGARPMGPGPDPSGVYRDDSLPREYPRPERPALPPGARPMPPAPDPSFVRSVPDSEIPRQPRIPRGLLPRRGTYPDVNELPSSGQVRPMEGEVLPGSKNRKPRKRLIPAAPIAYEVNPLHPVEQGGFRIAQYSGDPRAAAAPVIEREDVRKMLEVMRDEVREFLPVKGRQVRDPMDPNSAIYAYGSRGSGVGEDITIISGQNVSHREVLDAINDLLAGKRPTNKLHTAALDAALGYLEKRSGYQPPKMLGMVTEEDDFEEFSRFVDDLAGDE